ncbi:UMTA methyltransferase family protein-like protein [Dendryphion nanum]|uniref:UMTA methyltransferase family protein-like protein n=1 Tax=Dendryphion nanum TaxID=256645 RepID=A0A9P9D9D6_9PLEO|nr:UMTA methyltransferase family protein-like protein [Dendryphion nanum]
MVDLKDKYIISHGFAESGRLYLQHYLWRAQLGWELHPNIRLPEEGDIKFADYGCGNAAWLIAIASELSEAQSSRTQLYGYDIANVHFPRPENLPSNIKLGILDVFTPSLPDHLVSAFDVVHIRAFTAVVKGNNPGPLIATAYKMLKPGGFLQWDELDSSTLRAVPPVPSISGKQTQKMLDVGRESAKNAMNLDYSWLANVGLILAEHGFEVKVDERIDPKKELRKPLSDSMMLVHDNVRRRALKNGRMPGVDVDIDELWASIQPELEQGVCVLMDMLVLVAQKPA